MVRRHRRQACAGAGVGVHVVGENGAADMIAIFVVGMVVCIVLSLSHGVAAGLVICVVANIITQVLVLDDCSCGHRFRFHCRAIVWKLALALAVVHIVTVVVWAMVLAVYVVLSPLSHAGHLCHR